MDPISDMLISIKNAQAVKKETVFFPYSRLKMEIAKILQQEGFLKEVSRKGRKLRKIIEAQLCYDQETGKARIHDVRRVSKPSRRVYVGAGALRPVRKGTKGISILSTPKGLRTGRDAKRERIGGEILCEIW